MKIYELINADGSLYTTVETDDPQRELEVTQKYSPSVASFREYIEPEPEIVEENIVKATE